MVKLYQSHFRAEKVIYNYERVHFLFLTDVEVLKKDFILQFKW